MSRCCVAYIANKGYLFSTLLSATQAIRHVSPALADVAIFNIGAPHEESLAAERVCAREGIKFHHVATDAIDGMHIYFARLLIDRFLPAIYDQVLYIDGDTQIVGSLDPLIGRHVQPGRVLAARDPLALLARRTGRQADAARRRWAGLGIAEADYADYVNSGVLRFARAGWAELGERCVAAYRRDPSIYKFPDQDLINTVARDRLDYASSAWNFPGLFLAHGLHNEGARPRIIHFMANPRPWHGPLPHFKRTWHAPYLDLIARYPELAPFRPRLGPARYVKYILQQHYLRAREHRLWSREAAASDLVHSDREVIV